MKTSKSRGNCRSAHLGRVVAGAVALILLAAGSFTAASSASPLPGALTVAPRAPDSGAPDADVISVDFTADGPVEHVKDRPFTAEGTAPELVYDESLQRHVAEFAADEGRTSTGTGGYVFDIPDAWSKDDPGHVDDVDVTDGGTFECYFRYDGESPVPSGQTSQLCAGGPEGYGFYLPATGCCLRFRATATTANKNTATAPVPARSGEWVHAVATVGNGDIKLYLNGVPASEIPPEAGNGVGTGYNHLGPYTKLNVDSVPKWGIGAAPTATGISAPAHIAVAASRVWSTELTETQVADLWRREKPTPPEVDVPAADVLDVDFADDTAPFTDHSSSSRAPEVTGTTDVAPSPAFASQPHNAYVTDGEKDHVFYPLQDAWADTGKPHTDDVATYADDTWAGSGVTLQCDVKIDESLPVTGAPHFCAGKSGGGFGLHLSDSSVVASFHVNGGYKSVTSEPMQPGVWHSVVATYDGAAVDLYVDGELAGTNASGTTGPVKAPTAGSIIEPYVRFFAIGSDVKGLGAIETPAAVSVGTTRIWSSALSQEQVAQLDRDSFGDRVLELELLSSEPATGDVLRSPTELTADITNQDQATGWEYLLDGEPVSPGDEIGAGMKAGDHEIQISAVDVFGRPVSWTIPFTSGRIPTDGGTDTDQGRGSVTLSAIAGSEGGEVTTTFKEADLTVASDGVQGTVAQSPSQLGLDFADDVEGSEPITGPLTAGDEKTVESPSSHDELPFQRYDVQVPDAGRGQQVLWSGVVDPARAAKLWVWDNLHETWTPLDEARGEADDDTHLQGVVRPRMIDTTDPDSPVVHVLVSAEDPFTDDLSPRDESAGAPEAKDHLEDPDDYDFSFVHYTDQQYTTEAASGSQMDWPSSLPWQHLDGATNTPEEASVFEESLREQNEWIATNKDERKISFVANSGDVVNSEVSLNDLQFDPDATDPGDGSSVYDDTISDGQVPGAKQQVKNEFETILGLQGPLWESGVPNLAVAGNHDNRNGTHNGPTSPFAAFFSASGYYDQASSAWPTDASYHTMDEETDPETGEVVTEGADSSNNYVLFSAGGLDFVAVALSYGVTQEESDWADSVFKRYADRNGILVTHGYLSASYEPDGRNAELGADGSKLYDEVVRSNPNVFLAMGGHFHGVGTKVEAVSGATIDHKVVQLLADYQGYMVPASRVFTKERCAAAGLDPDTQCVVGTGEDSGKIDVDGDGSWDHAGKDKLAFGASFLRMLQFNTEKNTMSVDTYSPSIEEFGATPFDHGSSPKTTPEPIDRYNGAEDNFTVPINLSTRTTSFASDGLAVVTPTDEVIGSETVTAGFPASVEWTGLTEGETYAWVASSSRAGDDSGVVDQFGGMFVATAAGTDTEPPTLSIPEPSTIEEGATFDPRAGVTATDNTDGDVSDQIEVVGGVDTSAPGPYVLTYRVEDTNGNQAVGSRLVTVASAPEPDPVATSIEATDTEWTEDGPATLGATVTPAEATGNVEFHLDDDPICVGEVDESGRAECTPDRLARDLPTGTYPIVAVYVGDATHAPSQRAFVLTVDGEGSSELAESSVGASNLKVAYGKPIRLGLDVWGDRPTGTVTASDSRGDLGSTEIDRRGGVVRLPKRALAPGRHRITLIYGGDERNQASSATVRIRVTKARPKAVLTLKRKNRHHGKATLVATVRVNGAGVGVRPTGRVQLRVGKRVRNVRLRNGRVVVLLGRHRVKARPVVVAKYKGNRLFATVKVRKRLPRAR